MTDLLAVGLRALSYVAVLQGAGIALFLSVFGDGLRNSFSYLVRSALCSALIGLLLAVVYQLVEPIRLTGTLGGVLDTSLQSMLLGSELGTATAVRVAGLAMVAGGCLAPRRFGLAMGVVGATLAAASFAFMGHTASHAGRWLLASLLLLHLLVVAFWFGALLPLYRITRWESPETAGEVVLQFSRIAVWLVPLIFVAGLGMALVLVPTLHSLQSPYGALLLTKVAGFALLMFIAAFNKWRIGPAISAGNSGALSVLRLSVLLEWLLIAAVLAATATMTALYSPSP